MVLNFRDNKHRICDGFNINKNKRPLTVGGVNRYCGEGSFVNPVSAPSPKGGRLGWGNRYYFACPCRRPNASVS